MVSERRPLEEVAAGWVKEKKNDDGTVKRFLTLKFSKGVQPGESVMVFWQSKEALEKKFKRPLTPNDPILTVKRSQSTYEKT